MTPLYSIAVVWLFTYALCEDFCKNANFFGGAHTTFVNTPRPRDSPVLSGHNLNKRSTDPDGETCKSLTGFESTLKNNTHTYAFNDLSGSVSLAWVGDGTGVLLVLTTFQVPVFMIRLGQSKLYRSEDYGKTFQDVTHLINNTFVQTEFGIAIGPDNSGRVIMTGDVSEGGGSRIFRSLDYGHSFSPVDLPFFPLIQTLYNPNDSNVLLTLSISLDLWLSEDFGSTWRKIHDSVCLVRWGPEDSIYFTTNSNGSCNDKGMLELKRSLDYGKNIKTIASKIYSFVLGGRFVFASIMTGSGTQRMIHVSVDGGDVWNMAQLPTVGHEQFYSILAASDDMVFMHVDEPGDTGIGTIYISDDRGTLYSKSLERHLYTATGGDTDFTNVTSLRGVYMTSVLTEDGSVETVVSFDQGGEWRPVQRPRNSRCDTETITNRPDRCSLHIHALYSISMKMNVPLLPLTQFNAIGLILAHGSVGDPASVLSPDVYVSDDGGYSWLRALTGPHHYAILDSGGLLVAVEHTSAPVNQIKFSTDEGQCWHVYNFTSEPLYFTGLALEPGAHSMNLSLWGYRVGLQGPLSHYWVSVTIDFKQLLSRDCGEGDYVQWLAHSDDLNNPNDGCILGYKERFLRLRKDSVCWNGRDYVITTQPTPCQCTLDDYQCDYGYHRAENSSECVEQADLKGHVLEFCLHGTTEQLQTSGYRKIPGDRCVGGIQPKRKEIDLRRNCISNALHPKPLTEANLLSSASIVLVVMVILLISAATGVMLVKKYVCGGRFLVHRYSVLQQHAEANGIEGVDELDTHTTEMGKTHYHEDSDEDLLE
ncbi:sortilin-like [Oncorhynchus nerka]|uniref:sortilin-like n=1 Tax=Oncorhynchus nerka TaxID=8023 RepID=UPI001130ACD7|nr:sortilin-like isoform X1 [Oncorhynchus nerka]